jgi:hypothetical protein
MMPSNPEFLVMLIVMKTASSPCHKSDSSYQIYSTSKDQLVSALDSNLTGVINWQVSSTSNRARQVSHEFAAIA